MVLVNGVIKHMQGCHQSVVAPDSMAQHQAA